VGRERSRVGHAWVAGYGDEPSSHWLTLVDDAGRTRHAMVEYSYYMGVPGVLTNGGVNEHGVAVRDVWSPSRAELVAETPAEQTGPTYSDLARAALAGARSAREGAEIIGRMVDERGDTSYGGNSHLVADADEAWLCIQFAGGHRLWCARRLGASEIVVLRPGYVGEVSPDDLEAGELFCSANFFDLARDRGWMDGQRLDVNQVYGDANGPWAGARWIVERLESADGVGFAELAAVLRSPTITGDTAGYGQIVPLPAMPTHPDLRQFWHAPIGPVVAPFLPVWLGVESVPEEYRQHRYLTTGEDHRFIDLRRSAAGDLDALSTVSQGVESTRSAVAIFKRLLYLTFAHHEQYLPEVQAVWSAREASLRPLVESFTAAARALLDAGDRGAARSILTHLTHTEMRRALDDAEHLSRALEVRTRSAHGIDPDHLHLPEQLW